MVIDFRLDTSFRWRFLLGFSALIAICVPVYTWLSSLIGIEDRLLDVLVFMALFTLVSSVIAKVFQWEHAYRSDERIEYIHMVTVDKAAMVWMYLVFMLILVIVVAWGFGFIEVNSEVLGFVKGLGVSALVFAAASILAWLKVYKAYS